MFDLKQAISDVADFPRPSSISRHLTAVARPLRATVLAMMPLHGRGMGSIDAGRD
jgi:hypothetical protein